MALNIRVISESCWVEISKKVIGACVFIDDFSAECLHWHGGAMRFFNIGAKSVKEFSCFESGSEEDKKAVFITSSPVVGCVRMVLRDIISNSHFEHCILITACSPTALTLATTGNVVEGNNEMTAVGKLELDMLHWMKNKDYTVEIYNIPMSFIPVADYLFFTPPFQDLFPYLDSDLDGKVPNRSLFRKLDMESLPLELQIGIMHLVTTLNSLFSQLHIKEDIFYMGNLSSIIATKLQLYGSSSMRSKTSSTKVSLLLIDRTLDLSSATQLSTECLLDRVKTVLPNFPGHSIDVAVNMSPICASKRYNGLVPYGSLYQEGSDMIDWLINRKQKDILLTLHKELAAKEKNPMIANHVTPRMLEKQIHAMVENNNNTVLENAALFQQTLALVQTFTSPKVNTLEVVESIQKMLLLSVAAENDTKEAMIQLRQLVQSRHERALSFEMLLIIMVYFYSLLGLQFDIEPLLETTLLAAFSDALYEDKDILEDTFLNPLLPSSQEIDSKDTDEIANKIFTKLRHVREARKDLLRYKDLTHNVGPMEPLSYSNIISLLIADLVDPKKPDIPDLQYCQSGITESLRSRFSMLLTASKPHVMDNDIIFVFVVGGITAHEVCLIKKCFEAHMKKVFIGSTSIATPSSILNHLFVKEPLKPYTL